MKVVLLKPYLVARTNGGEISMLERLRLLKSWGADVSIHIALPEAERTSSQQILEAMGTPLHGQSYEVDGITCHVAFDPSFHSESLNAQLPMEIHFMQILEREKPDLVWSHYTDYFSTTAAVQWNAQKAWIDITDNEFPRQSKLDSVESVARHYLKIKNVMVASRFMEKNVRESLPWAETLLLPNIIECLEEKPVARSPEAWVFVNPTYVKGVDFAVELARKLPNEKFLFVGNWVSEKPNLLPLNVTFISRQTNLREVFRKAKGLLMPSVWEEAFGRVPLEAMAAGVPVLSSDRGALPETVGSGGLCLSLDLNRWCNAMSQSEDYWKTAIQAGFDRAKAYRMETKTLYNQWKQRFEKIL